MSTKVKPRRKAKPPRRHTIKSKTCTCGTPGSMYFVCPVHPERAKARPVRPRSLADMRSVSLLLRCRKAARIATGYIQEIKDIIPFILHPELRAEAERLVRDLT